MTAPDVTTALAPLLQRLLGAAIDLLGADRGTIHVGDPSDGALAIAGQIGFASDALDGLGVVDARFPHWREALDHQPLFVVEDVATDPRLADLRAWYPPLGVRSFQIASLAGDGGRPLGVLSIYRARPHRPSERELQLLDVLRMQVEQAVESKRVEEILRRSETGLRLALDAGQMGSFEWNIQTSEIRWSSNLEAIHGLAPGTFNGTFVSFEALIHPDDRARVLQTIRECVENGGDYEAEFRSAAHGDTAHWIMGKGKVLRDELGRPSRMLGVCMDVTRRKHAEEVVRESDRRKDEFLAMISHELRNPLAAIMNASELLDRVAGVEPAASQARGMIRRQTEQLKRIVNDLLDISRLTTGKLVLDQATLDLAGLAQRCIEELDSSRRFEQHRRQLVFARAMVLGDSVRLEQIVTNLLTNAIKFTPAGGTIAVEVACAGGEAVLRVRDTGVGIAPELLPRIFDLFVQSDRGLDRRDGGLGLGLAIVRRLVEAHGGRVEAHSAGLDLGAEIVVRLPLAEAPAAQDEGPVADAFAPGRRRILVIDDNIDTREALVALLALSGHEVHEAQDGPAGIAAASRLAPDMVLVDIGLPGLDGFEVARRLRAGGSHTRLVALTGYGQPDYRRRGAEAGFDAYLIKPVEIEAVLRELPGT